MKADLIANIQTINDISAWKVGEQILTPVFLSEKLKPQRVATFGEVSAKHGVDINELNDCQIHWGLKASMRVSGVRTEIFEGFNWKRTKSARSQGNVNFPSYGSKGQILSGGLYFGSQFRRDIDWCTIFETWCLALQPYGAILHPAINLEQLPENSKDIRDYSLDEEISQRAWSFFSIGNLHCKFKAGELNTLFSGLTNLGWATYFGEEYAHEVNQSVISNAGFPVKKIGSGYLVQVTEDINDVINNFTMFCKRRSELKTLFKKDLFLIKE